MTSPPGAPVFEPSGFFAFRSPLLAFDEIEAWSAGLEACSALDDPERLEQALARDRARLRAWLREALERPEIAEALFLASPSLFDALAGWRADPDSRKGKRAENSMVRYLQRMATRPTPFGTFSGCSLGTLDPGGQSPTCLRLGPRESYQRHTRLDMDYLFALCEDLGQDAAVRRELSYRPNTSLYRTAGRLRYAEARLDGRDGKTRSHHLVALEPTSYLEETLARAAGGAQPADLAAALVEGDPDGEVTIEDAEEYVGELIQTQILVSDLTPGVTGPEAIYGLEEQLAALPSGQAAAAALAGARVTLAELDAAGLGASPERYRAVAEALKELPTSVELSRLFQVDMVKPADAVNTPGLPPTVIQEMQRGMALLHRLFGRSRQETLERFRQDFSDRYGEGRWVPLAEALDEETGIGFERSEGGEASPLLQGLALGRPPAETPENTVPWGPLQAWQLRKLEETLTRGTQEIELTEKDLEKLGQRESMPLPDAVQAMAVLAAASEEDVDEGRFLLLWKGAGGPSGARLLGRFCHADSELEARVREHLEAEEAVRPDAVFAEIVHLPQGRIGNILLRPVLRGYEIPFLGRSGAPPERQIPLTDLMVTVSDKRIVLRSERLGREVIPRLTSAHNFSLGLGIYRFLCSLQGQGVLGGVGWNWGPLESAAFLPRVKSGRLVLERARWRLAEEEIKTLTRDSGATRFAAVQRWRAERRLPRRVLLGDGDNELLVDFDNLLSVEAWLDVIEGRRDALLFELFPRPEELCARGPEGRFIHELVVPFVRARSEAAARPASSRVTADKAVQRSFLPGSEWLYAKLYVGTSTADAMLGEVVGPLVRDVQSSGAVDSWFFIRYGDPQWHLRVRFHGAPERLVAEVLPALEAAVTPLLADGRLWRFQLDTYDREVERYGGPAGIGLCERLFHADSEAALAIVEMLEGDEGAEARWRLALYGTDLLLGDLGLDSAGKRTVLGQVREGFFREFGGGKPLRLQLDQKQRTQRRALEALLDPARADQSDLSPGFAILRRRSEHNAPLIAELRRLEQEGRLTSPVVQIAPSLVHMLINRLIRSSQRAHELVLYDLLAGIFESQAARAAKRPPAV
ncbi:MAG: lantibiotic biosynthesis protein [Acidobacteriota bacterium]|jgi:thiopeptide-type bacteriocin biosynthesis protein|nr:lantibiotic biosynthesis protein [Acidobacteriota bacterium]